ncbi:hypothetical protein HAX54_037866, partial [Datura stramonium]|nr:hypothetical protein [Datura stramonium]
VPTLLREEHLIEENQVVDNIKMRDAMSMTRQYHLNFPMIVDVEPDLESIHVKVPLREDEPEIAGTYIPPTSNSPNVAPTKPAL